MTITILDKAYSAGTYTARTSLKAYELRRRLSATDDPDASLLLKISQFLADEVFAGRFSLDDLMSGYLTKSYAADLLLMLHALCGQVDFRTANFPVFEHKSSQEVN